MVSRTLLLLVLLAPPGIARAAATAPTVQSWWPEHLDLGPLRRRASEGSPYGADFDYAAAFERLDLAALKRDLRDVLTTPQAFWPADYGHYGPLFIRMAWHSAGTYRTGDGRGGTEGGQQRFEPLGSWPDNTNLDKARRLLWPVKQKYGAAISWADLMILASNVALEDMGLTPLGFGGGRRDDWQPDLVYWGPERTWLGDERHGPARKLSRPLAAAQMGLIYVNPEGPGGRPDPLGSARDIREIFGRMAMDDEETVALVAGGHTFGKTHGAHPPGRCLGPEPAAAGVEAQGLGWKNSCGKGHGADTVTSGLEGAWTDAPTKWSSAYLDNLLALDWRRSRSPAGAVIWVPKNAAASVPDAHDPAGRHVPIMLTTDLALREDPAYRAIATRFREKPEEFAAAFARAWFKLTHRDMGPKSRLLGPEVPHEDFVWQDPVPPAVHPHISAADARRLKARILADFPDPAPLVRLAWGAASSFRDTDKRGGANGGRIRLAPQKDWAVNRPAEVAAVSGRLEAIAEAFAREEKGGKRVSFADMVVLGGDAAVERAAAAAGHPAEVPFVPGRTDARQEETLPASFAVLEPHADGFRNYDAGGAGGRPVEKLVDRAATLTLGVPEMAVLLGGLRVLGANTAVSGEGVLTARVGTLSPDFFRHLLDPAIEWRPIAGEADRFEGLDRKSGGRRWTATSVDLVFGSHSELRAVAETYAEGGAEKRFVEDFVRAWAKVMALDRFDVARAAPGG